MLDGHGVKSIVIHRGTFREETEGQSDADCTTCTEGHYCNGTGNVEAAECPKGTYSVSSAVHIQCFVYRRAHGRMS